MNARFSIRLLAGRLLAGTVLASMLACPSASASDPGLETRIKAAVVYKLAKFVEWPATSFEHARSPLQFCLLGDSPLAHALKSATGRTVSDHPVAVTRTEDLAVGDDCHVLYVSRAQQQRLPAVFARFADRPVLTISDIEGFAQRGGIVGLIRRGKRLGFQVNVDSAQRAGLVVSAPLLELADVLGQGS